MTGERLRVVLCWHMHQPDYRDPVGGAFMAPWVYLHALKDYTDMAAHLEARPATRATIDFTPVLLEQLDDYIRRLALARRGGHAVGDPLLDALAKPVLDLDTNSRQTLVAACLHAQRQRMIGRHPAYQRLSELAEFALERREAFAYLDDAFVFDLLVWYHLAWLGESVRRSDRRCAALIAKGGHFDAHDRAVLLDLVQEQLAALIPRYRALAEQGRIELATVPYAHPILPLLLAFDSAREARPDISLPTAARYPGGDVRAQRQLARASEVHRAQFGQGPIGCWSSEAAISAAALDQLATAGFRWTVSSQAVLRHSLDTPAMGSEQMHRPYRLHDAGTAIFFRDDELSDRIGFVYKDWAAHDAVADLIHRLEALKHIQAEPGRVVVLALDGENAWEHYEANGEAFLGNLYAALSDHPNLEMTTLGRCLDDPGVPMRRLERVVAGSWIHGDLGTWIGRRGKNRAWDMLVDAKHCFDRADPAAQAAAERQLAVCEGSDWFWWLDEHHAEVEVARYERLYRVQLAGLHHLLGCVPPDYLGHPFTHGAAGLAEAPVMLRHHEP